MFSQLFLFLFFFSTLNGETCKNNKGSLDSIPTQTIEKCAPIQSQCYGGVLEFTYGSEK